MTCIECGKPTNRHLTFQYCEPCSERRIAEKCAQARGCGKCGHDHDVTRISCAGVQAHIDGLTPTNPLGPATWDSPPTPSMPFTGLDEDEWAF